jgi:two-component system, NarL family, invasion response regulator UvrY
MENRNRCLIVDDHPIVRKGLRDLLMQEKELFDDVMEAATAEAALETLRQGTWRLVILDVALPDKHGLELLKEIKLLHPGVSVLMLSLYPEREFALRSLKAGAAGYMTKDRPPSELLEAVRAVVAGRRYITGSLAGQLATFIDQRQPVEPHDILSDRELEVLRLLGQGKTVSLIAGEMVLSVKTVSTYRARILDKLELQTTAELVRYALEHHLAT